MIATGRIRNPEAYIRAKLLDHSGWQELLPRMITPSDIDMAIDNRHGHVIFCELSRSCREWRQLQGPQRELYENCIKNTTHLAALLYHEIDSGEIDTVAHIDSFQVMLHDPELGFGCNIVLDAQAAQQWPRFVQRCFENPDAERWMQLEMIRRRIAREQSHG